MEVILMEDITELGKIGDVVKVRDGYARNYLIPEKKAIRATTRNLKKLQHEKQLAQHRVQKVQQSVEALSEKISGLVCLVKKSAGETGKLFGQNAVENKFRQQYMDDKSYAAEVLNTLLAGGMSSRLFSEIREKRIWE